MLTHSQQKEIITAARAKGIGLPVELILKADISPSLVQAATFRDVTGPDGKICIPRDVATALPKQLYEHLYRYLTQCEFNDPDQRVFPEFSENIFHFLMGKESINGATLSMPKFLLPSADAAFSGLLEPDRKIAEQLRRDGYAILDFPESNFDSIADAIVARLTAQLNLPQVKEGFFSADPDFTNADRVQDCPLPEVRQLAKNQEILRLLGAIYGRQAFPFQTLNFPKGTQQALHSDTVHFSCLPQGFMCGVWVALEDVHDDSGPIEYVARSHLLPELQNHDIYPDARAIPDGTLLKPSQRPFEAHWLSLASQAGLEISRFLAKKGTCLIWAHNLLHGGAFQRNPMRSRWSQVTHYYFEGCSYYTPMLSDFPKGKIAVRNPTPL